MALSMTPARFEDIRRQVVERRIVRAAADALQEMNQAPQQGFTTVDSFMRHLDMLVACDRRRNRRRSSRNT